MVNISSKLTILDGEYIEQTHNTSINIRVAFILEYRAQYQFATRLSVLRIVLLRFVFTLLAPLLIILWRTPLGLSPWETSSRPEVRDS